jgi:hypothetical protein
MNIRLTDFAHNGNEKLFYLVLYYREAAELHEGFLCSGISASLLSV